MSSASQKPSKLETELKDLQLDLYEKEAEITRERKEAREARQTLNEIKQRMNALKEEYKDQKYKEEMLRHSVWNKTANTSRIRSKIRTIELQTEMISIETRKKEEKKALKKTKNPGFTDPFLQKVNQLPEVLVDIIGSFLPKEIIFDIKISILESRVKTQKLISRCSAPLKTGFLKKFSSTRQFLGLLPYEEAVQQTTSLGKRYWYVSSAKEAELKTLHLIELAKASNSELAFDMLKKLHILIDPTKKYKCPKERWNYQPFNFGTLTMEDVDASRNLAL